MLDLLARATRADGVRPVSEEAELRLQHGGPPGGRDVLARDADGTLVGYARVERTGMEQTGAEQTGADTEPAGTEAELVVLPAARRRRVGSALLDRVEALSPTGDLHVWAHGQVAGSTELATGRGYRRARVLLQLRRPLTGVDPAPRPPLPPDVTIRPFRPGIDEQAWLAVNARAFAAHPEQGRWTPADLALREAEAWFDPAGFFLAWQGGPGGERLLGFHWTKVHPAGDAGPDPVGEVYVLGVDPDAQGLRLGRALTDVGLGHLAAEGLGSVLLYVEEENAVAVGLYERSGFTRHAVDVNWARPTG